MKRISFIVASFIFLSITSCDKKEDSTTTGTTKTRVEYLTSAAWKQTAITVSPGITIGGTTITDLYSIMPACQKDDSRKFNTGGSGIDDNGTNRCDSTEGATTPFTWSLINSESKLVIFQDGSYDTTNITSVDASTFKGSTVMDGAELGQTAGTKYTLTITATH